MNSESELDSVIFYVFFFSSVHFSVGHKLFSNKSYILTLDVFPCKLTSMEKCFTLDLPINFIWVFFTCSAIYSVVVHF